jgi:tryptophan halogenase
VKFRSGSYRRNWIQNVIAVGNASGFVEPLEATALSVLVLTINSLVETLREGRITDGLRTAHNRLVRDVWEETRDFLALHYRLNTRLDTPFWRHSRGETPLHSLSPLFDFFQENGPSPLGRHYLASPDNVFGIEGHLAILVGNQVPYRNKHAPSTSEVARWNQHQADLTASGNHGLAASEALRLIRHPAWRWP